MKYGNFVGKGWGHFSDTEIEHITLHLKTQLEEVFGKEFFGTPTVKYDGKELSESDHKIISIYIQFPLVTPFSGRNRYYDTIMNVTSVNFFITKDTKGYLEIKDWSKPVTEWERDYENCPDFSYLCHMSVTGKERPYRHKNWESIQNWSPCTYGTEVIDLTYEREDLENMKNKITR